MTQQKIYTWQFMLLCFSSLLFFSSFNMIIPELPAFLTSIGGGDYKGLIISVFTLTAGLSRPFSGKLADKVGRVPVMVFGATVSGLAALVYPHVTVVWAFLLLRFFHGFSTGFKPTGTAAYVGDIAPLLKRGEAMGIFGLFGSMGMAIGPAIGSYIASAASLNTMFYTSSLMALLSVVILAGMRETLVNREKFRPDHLKINWADVYEPRVLYPSVTLLLTMLPFGAVLTLAPDFSDYLGMGNRGLYFTTFTIASLGIRFIAGKASDKYGRVAVLRFSIFFLVAAMITTGFSTSVWQFLTGAVLFGIGTGMNSPTIYAWTIDLSDERHRGRGIATMYIALEVGIGLGALLAGWLYGNHFSHMPFVFSFVGFVAFLGWVFVELIGKKKDVIPSQLRQ
ncbi:MFS transporter [uncultured Imperialibacter sp.]|uniref:MFS transporter n=1 Tax=uncultured Imperialibacter sp. TaxID=1672639 RepID=UPI0030DD0FAD